MTVESREFQETDKKTTRSITPKDVEEALIRTNYNKSETARLLGIDRKTLYNRLRNVISQAGLKITN
ncbi:hypothetical protein GCM10023091_29370 [Ravibacter arvi]|uniref:DNA binding HTH domain-containing protein n=1 Tax=Ravibacter arvi TaxID=2051041 RepID=A0ABP8M390_9BACT